MVESLNIGHLGIMSIIPGGYSYLGARSIHKIRVLCTEVVLISEVSRFYCILKKNSTFNLIYSLSVPEYDVE